MTGFAADHSQSQGNKNKAKAKAKVTAKEEKLEDGLWREQRAESEEVDGAEEGGHGLAGGAAVEADGGVGVVEGRYGE